jgi:hypothetical protein
MKKINLILVLIFYVFLVSCQHTFTALREFYRPNLNVNQITTHVELISVSSRDNLKDILRKGYRVIGVASFSMPKINNDELIRHGKEKGADIIAIFSEYYKTDLLSIPITKYIPGDSATISSRSTYNYIDNNNNSGQIYGQTNSTVSSQGKYKTDYVPVNINRYNYSFYYLKKLNVQNLKLGFSYTEIDTDTRIKINSNAGLLVDVVFNDGYAFKNDIIEGDIILELNNKKIYSEDQFQKELSQILRGDIVLKIWRNGSLLTKNI